MDLPGAHLQASELEYLVEHAKSNEEYERILRATNESAWIFDNGSTLLHSAVSRGNVKLIKYLSLAASEAYVNAKNPSGDTALLQAAKSNNVEAVKSLLNAGADVCAADPSTGIKTFRILINRPWTEDIVSPLMSNLKRRSDLAAETLVELLVSSECPVEYVLTMNDPRISRDDLQRVKLSNRERHWFGMLSRLKSRDLEYVKLKLFYGGRVRKLSFYHSLRCLEILNQLDTWTFFVEHLSAWNVLGEEALQPLDLMFSTVKTEYLRVLLDCKIDARLRLKFGVDMRTCVFGNRLVDAVELLREHRADLDVNATSMWRQTALHLAAQENLAGNVGFLLDCGADVDKKNHRGRTALFDCVEFDGVESGQLLLENGADVRIFDENGWSVFDVARGRNGQLAEFLIARLAICQVEGGQIERAIRDRALVNENYRDIYEACCEQLRALETCQIAESVTLFSFLTGKIETMYRFVGLQDVISAVLQQYKDELHFLYYSTMKNKLKRMSNLYRFACNVADVIFKSTGTLVDFDHLVVRKISEYLTHWDIETFITSFLGEG